ncbi:gliding motility-associated ABC transporter permease subunit GldF [Arenibacter sp. GZD96]|uniref:gliding motility-associated ABC transporter permease subunit GldF n=1 Tax=Aurantibrevibacter litoralis TaxID=3106030 RepID=UPI002AFEA67E|nr:gliding motility-associated ABC transporter permease subunit GldF [Arenibacter sp. GZD-96]MEA1787640.1 gliding motility-associated ABC transporter permease subunit GldF [Arenibacter sp. GZD-96]
MLAIFKREITTFFTSAVGYLVIGLFLILSGLFLWVFKGAFNVFDYGFADLEPFFQLAPWVFLFVIPALTMKSFSEEKKLGTLELLLIKPIPLRQVVGGKFFGILTLAILAVLPTLLYVLTVFRLGITEGNVDMGVVLGSYFGLLLLIACYAAIGIFASIQTDNQIVSFITATVLCFILFYGFDAAATLFPTGNFGWLLKNIGMKSHFDGFTRGILDSRDLVYFVSLSFLFLALTVIQLQNTKRS